MSCYEWMEGTLRMRPAQASQLQKLLIAQQHKDREKVMKLINDAVDKVLLAFKGKRAVQWGDEVFKQIELVVRQQRLSEDLLTPVYHSEKLFLPKGRACRPVKLKDKDVPKANTKTTSFDLSFAGTLHIDKAKGLVTVCVSENNHAVEDAERSEMWDVAYKFFNALDWPRGGGGEIAYNNEYQRESRCVDGGGNSSRHSWYYKSPAAKKKEQENERKRRTLGYGGGYGSRLNYGFGYPGRLNTGRRY